MPIHKHDCLDCVFYGTIAHQDKRLDIYRCPQHGFPTWIARYGSEGPEYTSLPEQIADGVSDGNVFYDILKPFIRRYLKGETK